MSNPVTSVYPTVSVADASGTDTHTDRSHHVRRPVSEAPLPTIGWPHTQLPLYICTYTLSLPPLRYSLLPCVHCILIDGTAVSVRVFGARQRRETNAIADRNTLEAHSGTVQSTHDRSSSMLGQSSRYLGY